MTATKENAPVNAATSTRAERQSRKIAGQVGGSAPSPHKQFTTNPKGAQAPNMGNAAKYYAEHFNLAVLPLNKKQPVISGGFKNASKDLEQISKWWTQRPEANIGIRTGEGLVVLDVDRHGADGVASLEALEKEYGPLPNVDGRNGGRRLPLLLS